MPKAILIEKEFENSHIAEFPEPVASDIHEILNVKAVGICQSDIARVFNQSAYHYPIVLGHEFAGCLDNGQKATVFPLIPCKSCDECKSGNYAQCSSYSYYGSREDGGMQERIAINKWNLIEENELDYEELALIEPCAVALNAFRKCQIGMDSILINGCGFISLVLAQLLIACDKKVHVRNRNKAKLKFALDNFDLIECNNKTKFDCVFDFVSNSDSMNFIIDSMKPHGSIILVGNPSNQVVIEKQNYSKILRKELEINGIWNSRFADWTDMIDVIKKKKIDVKKLITHRYDFKDFKKAFETIRNNQINHDELVIKSIIYF